MSEIDKIAELLGLEGTSLLACLAVISLICRLIGKSIPDDATGVQGMIRRVTKLLGLYVSNRITSGTSVSDVAKTVVNEELSDRLASVEQGQKPFPGVRDERGRFVKTTAPLMLALLLLPMALGGCATASAPSPAMILARTVCSNTDVLAAAILDIRSQNTRERAIVVLRGLESACPLLFPKALAEANRRAALQQKG